MTCTQRRTPSPAPTNTASTTATVQKKTYLERFMLRVYHISSPYLVLGSSFSAMYPRRPRRVALWGGLFGFGRRPAGPFGRHAPRAARVHCAPGRPPTGRVFCGWGQGGRATGYPVGLVRDVPAPPSARGAVGWFVRIRTPPGGPVRTPRAEGGAGTSRAGPSVSVTAPPSARVHRAPGRWTLCPLRFTVFDCRSNREDTLSNLGIK